MFMANMRFLYYYTGYKAEANKQEESLEEEERRADDGGRCSWDGVRRGVGWEKLLRSM